jgi:hypothetical protein
VKAEASGEWVWSRILRWTEDVRKGTFIRDVHDYSIVTLSERRESFAVDVLTEGSGAVP